MGTKQKKPRHWLAEYETTWLRSDLVAGLTSSAVVIPKCMAFAGIAGLSLEVGLYAALVPMVIYALLGTSSRLSVSTTTTIAILVASNLAVLGPQAGPDERLVAVVTLTMLVGALLLIAAIFRLGFLANFISDPVLTGFKAGIALVIIADQVPKLLGVHIEKSGFFRNIGSIVNHLPDTSLATLALSVVVLVLIVGLERFVPKAPAPIVAVVVSIAAAWLLGLEGSGVELVGAFQGGLPRPMLPELSLVGQLWPAALGIALMAFTESIAAGRSFTPKGEPRPSANRELVALGLANLLGGLFRAMPSGGGTSQTAVNAGAGAQTQAAELVTAAMVAATLLFLGPVVGLMPQATLAAVVIATTVGLFKVKDFRSLARIRSMELIWAIVACVGVVLLGTLEGILVAVSLSMLTLMYQANHPPIYVMSRKPGTHVYRQRSEKHPEDETYDGLLMVRTEGRLTFASAPNTSEKLHQLIDEATPIVVALDLSSVPDIEYTALSMLTALEGTLRENGISMWLVGLNPEPLKVIRRAALGEALGRKRMFFNLENAVEAYLSDNDDSKSSTAPERKDS